jgi:hypothetical protein
MASSLTERLPGPKERGGGHPVPAHPTLTFATIESLGIPKKKETSTAVQQKPHGLFSHVHDAQEESGGGVTTGYAKVTGRDSIATPVNESVAGTL